MILLGRSADQKMRDCEGEGEGGDDEDDDEVWLDV